MARLPPRRGAGAPDIWTSSADDSSDGLDVDDFFENDEDGPELGPELRDDEPGELEELGEFLSDRALQNLTGSEDLNAVTFLEVRIDTDDIVLRDLGARLPRLTELKMNSSNVRSFRDLGTSFGNLTVLWLARSNVLELDGVGSLTHIKELYLAFNEVADLSPLAGCEELEALDLEGNQVAAPADAHFLEACARLTALTLDGNPAAKHPGYRRDVLAALPQLAVLDDVERAADDGASEDARADATAPAPPGAAEHAAARSDAAAEHAAGAAGAAADPDELLMVHQGIKHARTGFDDADYIPAAQRGLGSAGGGWASGAERPGTARRPGSGGGARPASATFRPGSARTASPAESEASGRSARSGDSGGLLAGLAGGRVEFRPGTAGVRMEYRPGTAGGRRPGTASGARPGTASGARPGTARGARASEAGQIWAARRSARAGGGGAEGGAEGSELTHGTGEVYCGNLARGLRRRNVAQAGAAGGAADGRMSCDEILEELRRWKAETVVVAETGLDEDGWGSDRSGDAPAPALSPLASPGAGEGAAGVLAEGDFGGLLTGGAGGAGGAADEEDEEDDMAELARLQERCWSRIDRAAAEILRAGSPAGRRPASALGEGLGSGDAESRAPTARGVRLRASRSPRPAPDAAAGSSDSSAPRPGAARAAAAEFGVVRAAALAAPQPARASPTRAPARAAPAARCADGEFGVTPVAPVAPKSPRGLAERYRRPTQPSASSPRVGGGGPRRPIPQLRRPAAPSGKLRAAPEADALTPIDANTES